MKRNIENLQARIKIYILIVVGATLLSACSIPSSQGDFVSYLVINKVELETTINEGTNTHNIKDVWIFINGVARGVFELPARVPLVYENIGETLEISIQAGIRENGINSSPAVYPFFSNYEMLLDPDEDQELTIIPKFVYREETMFRLIADFEGSNSFTFDEDGNIESRLDIFDGMAADGMKSGLLSVPAEQILEQGSTSIFNGFPKNGSPIFVEIDYKGNLDLDIGLIGTKAGQLFKDYFVSLRSDTSWKKTYINLTSLVTSSDLDGYQILLGCDNSLRDQLAEVYVDNIKLLHF